MKVAEEIGNISTQRIACEQLGSIYRLLGLEEDAYSNYKLAIHLSELIGHNLVEEHYKIWFNEALSNNYDHMINTCLDLGRNKELRYDENKNIYNQSNFVSEALDYVERSKSRAFLDLLSLTIEIRLTDILEMKYSSLLKEEKMLRYRLKGVQMRHLSNIEEAKVSETLTIQISDLTDRTVGAHELQKIKIELDKIYDIIKEDDPEYVYLRRGTPTKLGKIKNMLI